MKIARSALIACCLFLAVRAVVGQTDEDTKQKVTFTSLMNSGAETIYKLAWPTATYKSWEWSGFARVAGGYKIIVKFNGLSGFDDSSLSLKLGMLFNSDGIKDFWVVDHNAILMPPFFRLAFLLLSADQDLTTVDVNSGVGAQRADVVLEFRELHG